MRGHTAITRRRDNADLRAVEVRRLTFRVSEPLEHHGLPDANKYALGGDEYALPADRYDQSVRAMKRAGFTVRTVWDLYRELPYIQYRRVGGGFWYPRPGDEPRRWYYLSPLTRHWRRVPNQGGKLVVRNGWALCHFPEGQRWPEFYYLERDKSLDECKTRGDLAIRRAYSGVVGIRPLPCWMDDRHIYGLWPGYVLPKEHEQFLVERLSPHAEAIEAEIGKILLWRAADLTLVEKCLKGLRLELRPWSPSEDWVQTLSVILRHSYAQLLHKKSNLPRFQNTVRRRAWDEIEDETLRELLSQLGEAEYGGDITAFRVLRFLSEKLPSCIDWRDYPSHELFVFALESSRVTYRGRDTGNRYYRLVLPSLEIVVGWKTKIMTDWRAEHRQAAVVSHWRVLPFLGRMRTAPVSKIVVAWPTGEEIASVGRAIVGIPGVEWELAEVGCMDAFSIDLDPAHWRGHHDLMRYFMGYAQVVRHNPPECDTPGLLMRDMLGFDFVLEDIDFHPEEMPQPGDWTRFIARCSLMDHDKVLKPTFAMCSGRHFTLVSEAEALYMTLLAIVKYHFGISADNMARFLAGTPLEGLAAKALSRMLREGDVVAHRGLYFYRYSEATAAQMQEYARNPRKNSLPLPYHHLRGILHPLWARASYLRGEDEFMIQPRERPPLVIVRREGVGDLAKIASRYLEQKGAVCLSGIGFRRSQKTGEIVNRLFEEFAANMLLVRRRDRVHLDDRKGMHPHREYLVLLPASLLKHHLEGRHDAAGRR